MLEPINDRIIHVIASPGTKPSSDKSLCVVAFPLKGIKYNISDSGDTLVLSTSALKAQVSISTGQITFMNADGKVFLAEPSGGREIVLADFS